MALAQQAPLLAMPPPTQRSFCVILVMSLSLLAVHEVGLYRACRYRGPAGTMGPCKALDHVYKAGVGKVLRGQLSTRGGGGGRDGGKPASTECRGAEAPGRGIPGFWETVAAGGVGGGGVSIPAGSPVCLEDWRFSERYRKGLAGLGREGKLRRLAFFLEY